MSGTRKGSSFTGVGVMRGDAAALDDAASDAAPASVAASDALQ